MKMKRSVLTKLLFVLMLLIMMQSMMVQQVTNAAKPEQDRDIQESRVNSADLIPIFQTTDIPEMRTLFSKTYRADNGEYKLVLSKTPMHYESEDGGLYDIDTNLIDMETYEPTDFKGRVSKENKGKFNTLKEYKKNGKSKVNENLAHFSSLKVPYEFDLPKNIKNGYSIGKGSDKLTFIPVNASSSKGKVDKEVSNKVVYENVWKSTTLALYVLPNGIKEDIILLDAKAPQSFTFEVKGDLDKNNQAGELSLAPMWLIDKEGTRRNVEVVTRKEGNKTYIDLKWDQQGLVYPITIDPTVMIDQNTDYRICNSNFYSGFGVGTSCTSYLAFDLSSLPAAMITNATFSVNVDNAGPPFYAVLRQLDSPPIMGYPSPSYSTTGATETLIPDTSGWKYGTLISFDATQIVKNSFRGSQVYLGAYYAGGASSGIPRNAYGRYYFYTSNLGTPTLTITYEPIIDNSVIWKLDTSKLTTPVTTLGDGDFIGSDVYQPGIQIADKDSSSMQMYKDGALGINPSGGQYKAINIETGTAVGGTNYYTHNGFLAEANKTYTITFDAYVASGTGQVRVRANSKMSSDWELAAISATPTPVSLTWTQVATGGNIQIDTGSTAQGTIVYFTNLQITDPSSADEVVWKLDTNKLGVPGTLGGGEYIGNDSYQPGIQIPDKGATSVKIFNGGRLEINSTSGQYKAIILQTGTAVGGTDYYASDGFVALAGRTYKVTFNAYIESNGTGQVRVTANLTASGNVKVTTLSENPTPVSYTWTQSAIGGNIKIDTGNTPQGINLIIKDLQITDTDIVDTETPGYIYDSNNRLIRVILPNGDIYKYTYDANGNLLTIRKL